MSIHVACESVDPDMSTETGDPGVVIVRMVCGGKVAEKLAMREASRLAAGASHVAFHALRVEMTGESRMPLAGDRLATRKDGADYVAIVTAAPCRCGHTGDGPHPCHADGYACRKPAEQRFYQPPTPLASLAGMQLKFSMVDTWACDQCWQAFQEKLGKAT